jgi:hypothetical protein
MAAHKEPGKKNTYNASVAFYRSSLRIYIVTEAFYASLLAFYIKSLTHSICMNFLL